MNIHRYLIPMLVAFMVALFGTRADAAIKVVATTPDLAAIARQVGGSAVEVTTLSLPTQDPHFVDARPHLALALNKADLLIVQGLELEAGWLPTLQASARNAKIKTGGDGYLDCSRVVAVLEVPSGAVSRAQGDIHAGGNPHYLFDPKNGGRVAMAIAARLGSLEPRRAGEFTKNASDLDKAAVELAGKQAARFAALDASKRKVVVYHRSWIYLETWLGLTEVGAVEPKPGIPPDPGHVAKILGLMKSESVRAILSEEYYPQATNELLAEKTGAELVVTHGGTRSDEAYLDHVREVADAMFAALSK